MRYVGYFPIVAQEEKDSYFPKAFSYEISGVCAIEYYGTTLIFRGQPQRIMPFLFRKAYTAIFRKKRQRGMPFIFR